MKNVLKIVLVLVIIGLGYACISGIRGSITFTRTKEAREAEIIQALMDVRTAQIAYKQEYFVHIPSIDGLRDWLANGKVKTVRKQLELSEKQLEDGMTEQEAVNIVKKAEATGNWKDAEAKGLSRIENGTRISFRRDTMEANPAQTLFPKDFDLSKFGYVPTLSGVEFEMDTASVITGSGYDIKIFEAKVPYTAYLGDLDKRELANLIDKQEQLGRYPGLKVGSLTEINNYAGNWE